MDTVRATHSRTPFGTFWEIEAAVGWLRGPASIRASSRVPNLVPGASPHLCRLPRAGVAYDMPRRSRPSCRGSGSAVLREQRRGVSQGPCLLWLSPPPSTPSMWINEGGGGMAEEGEWCGCHRPDAAASGALRA